MAANNGFSFGTTNNNSNLFGPKTTTSTFSFGTTPAFTGFGSINNTSASTSLSFGATITTTSSGFSFGGFGGGLTSTSLSNTNTGTLFGSKPSTTGFGLFDTKSTSITALPFQLGVTTNAPSLLSNDSLSLSKPLENPKEEKVPIELVNYINETETYLKTQRELRDEISRISSQSVNKIQEQLNSMNQAIALISNSLQRDKLAAEHLKNQVGQELKNSETARLIRDLPQSSLHDFNAPMQYFQSLVYSFQARINKFRQEIEELEVFLSSSSPSTQFTPQDLKVVLKRLSESFLGLAAELQTVHEAVKTVKQKYLQFLRTTFNDYKDPFTSRKKKPDVRENPDFNGPSPFPAVQGAGIISTAFKNDNKPQNLGYNLRSTSSSSKPNGIGLTRSLSFDGTAKSNAFGVSNEFGSSFGNNSLIGQPTLAVSNALNMPSTPSAFKLRNPPNGKRGKLY